MDPWDRNLSWPVEVRTPSDRKFHDQPAIPDTEEDTEEKRKEDAYILCRQCRQPITHPNERISVEGAHMHTFANPHGIVFDIACFRSVIGCGYVGPATDEFSWFSGYRWRIVICSACLTHLGWLFTSTGSDSFVGLIIDRLIQPH